jgi:prepilin-type N-terminal cleavage/methylation domain-containing protein
MTTADFRYRLREERGMTLIELCIVITILAILMAIATAALLSARVSANEVSAIGALKTINTAQVAYAAGCGGGNYAQNLVVLGTKPPGARQGYLSEDLSLSVTTQRSGYDLNITDGKGSAPGPADCNMTPTVTNYYATGVPVAVGKTGTRAFATSQRNGVYQLPGGTPPSEPFGPPAQLAQ